MESLAEDTVTDGGGLAAPSTDVDDDDEPLLEPAPCCHRTHIVVVVISNNNNNKSAIFIVGTCESFFCVRIESRIESAVRFDFESNFRIGSAVYTTQAVTPSNELQGAPCRRTV